MEFATNPVFHPTKPTKILFSPGMGAGWVTYAPHGASDAFLVWMLTYEPLIKGLEKREHKGMSLSYVLQSTFDFVYGVVDKLEDILRDFHKEAHVKFNVERIMVARVGDLVVQEVSAPFEIRETDGMEKIFDVGRRKTLKI